MEPRSENEKYFYDPKTKSRKQFPTLNESHSKYLSIIIPAYKEVDRCNINRQHVFFYRIKTFLSFLVPAMIKDTMDYIEERQVGKIGFRFKVSVCCFFFKKKDSSFTYELIIVDDGSPDKTSEV